jgi:hypothetical protein
MEYANKPVVCHCRRALQQHSCQTHPVQRDVCRYQMVVCASVLGHVLTLLVLLPPVLMLLKVVDIGHVDDSTAVSYNSMCKPWSVNKHQ